MKKEMVFKAKFRLKEDKIKHQLENGNLQLYVMDDGLWFLIEKDSRKILEVGRLDNI